MRRSEWMSIQQIQQFPSRPIIRHRIRSRSQAIEGVLPLRIRLELPSQVEVALRIILLLIQPISTRLPYIDPRIRHRFLGDGISDLAMHVGQLAVVGHGRHDVGVVVEDRVVVAEEGAQDGGCGCGIGGFAGEFEGYFVNETVCILLASVLGSEKGNTRLKSNNVTNQLPLVPLVVAHSASPIHDLYARHPFVDSQFILPSEVVDVADQAAHYLAHAGSTFRPGGFDDLLCEVRVESCRRGDIGGVGAVRRHIGRWRGFSVGVVLCTKTFKYIWKLEVKIFGRRNSKSKVEKVERCKKCQERKACRRTAPRHFTTLPTR